jgi:hypothetical protein
MLLVVLRDVHLCRLWAKIFRGMLEHFYAVMCPRRGKILVGCKSIEGGVMMIEEPLLTRTTQILYDAQ